MQAGRAFKGIMTIAGVIDASLFFRSSKLICRNLFFKKREFKKLAHNLIYRKEDWILVQYQIKGLGRFLLDAPLTEAPESIPSALMLVLLLSFSESLHSASF